MAFDRKVKVPFVYSFIFSLLATFTIIIGTETDIYCLKSIKDSLVDTHNYFNSSWNFDNNTEGFICTFLGVECWHHQENKVLNLRLSDLGLNGQFPQGLENCTSLTGLDLSSNQLQGPIPSDIGKRLPHLTSLDLSFNDFSGEIPSSIADCHCLNFLKLDHNKLTGHIPPKIGQLNRIKIFSVANNLLSGPVPNFVGSDYTSDDKDSFANNKGLCGKPLKSCSSHQLKFDYSFKGGFVIGYVVCATSVVVLFTFYCVPWVPVGTRNGKITISEMIMLMRRKKHTRREDDQARSSPTVELLEEGTKEISMLKKRVTRMSYAYLNEATNNFSENKVIGHGKMGILYKASLPNGYDLAVKKLHDSQFLEEQFISELKILGSLRHDNLLPLLGFCVESKQRFLVYKYMPNGSLYDWLHQAEGQAKTMEWGVRLKVAIGLARGLAWLHHDCDTIRIIHLDISSKCILLDKNFEPKLSNFGEAMLMRSTNTSDGLNNEFWEMAFVKEDVHGFGVVLLEMITGVDISRMTDFSNGILNEWIGHLLNSSNLYDAIDKSLIGHEFDSEISQLLEVACNCVDPIPDRRPTMLQVYEEIKEIRKRNTLVDNSEIVLNKQPEIYPASSEDKSVYGETA